jgi:Sec-independent protein translocase protein TatA
MPVNMTAIWVLDIVIALGMISAAIAVLALGRKLGEFSKSISATMVDMRKQADDLKSEAVRLMQSTQVSEQHFDRLARQLTKLTASADTAVRALPAAASGRDSGLLPRMMSTVVRVVSAYKFFKFIFLRRKS